MTLRFPTATCFVSPPGVLDNWIIMSSMLFITTRGSDAATTFTAQSESLAGVGNVRGCVSRTHREWQLRFEESSSLFSGKVPRRGVSQQIHYTTTIVVIVIVSVVVVFFFRFHSLHLRELMFCKLARSVQIMGDARQHHKLCGDAHIQTCSRRFRISIRNLARDARNVRAQMGESRNSHLV